MPESNSVTFAPRPHPTGSVLGATLLKNVADQFAGAAQDYLQARISADSEEKKAADAQPLLAGRSSRGLSPSASLSTADFSASLTPQPTVTSLSSSAAATPQSSSLTDAQCRIDALMKAPRTPKAQAPTPESAFVGVLRTLRRLAKHSNALALLLNAALRWRLSALQRVKDAVAEARTAGHMAASVDTRFELIADFVLGYAAASMLAASSEVDGGTGARLDKHTEQFEEFAQTRIRLYLWELRPHVSSTINVDRSAVAEFYSRSLAVLYFPDRVVQQAQFLDRPLRFLISRRHAPAILKKFVTTTSRLTKTISGLAGLQQGDPQAGPVASSDQVSASFLRSLRFARFHHAARRPEPVVEFLKCIQGYSALPCAPAVQEAISDVLVDTLGVLDPSRLPESAAWDEISKSLFERFSVWVSNQKRAHIVYPGFAALLTIQRSTIYTAESPRFLRECFRTYNSPKAQNERRAASLKSLLIFLKADFKRSTKTHVKAELDEILQRILLTYSPWAGNDRHLIVDILVVVASQVDPAIAEQIFNAMTDHGGDATIAVLSAYQNLFDVVEIDSAPLASVAEDDFTHSGIQATNRPWLHNLASPVAILLGGFSEKIRSLIQMSASQVAKYTVDAHEIPLERAHEMKVLTASLHCWYMTLRYLGDGCIKLLSSESVASELLFRLCSHSRKMIRVEAQRVLSITFLRFPSVRAPYLNKISKTIKELPYSQSKFAEELMAWTSALVLSWTIQLTDRVNEVPTSRMSIESYDSLQARIVWLLLHPQGSVRLKARKLFLEVEEVFCLVNKTSKSTLRPLRDLRETPISVVGGPSTEEQKLWRKIFADLILRCCTDDEGNPFIPHPLQIIWSEIFGRLAELRAKVEFSKKPDLLKTKSRGSAIEKAIRWPFLAAFACSMLVVERDSDESNSSVLQARKGIETGDARELFRVLTSAWVAAQETDQPNSLSSQDDIRDTIPEAMSYIHPLGVELLLPEIRRSVEEWLASEEGGPGALRRLRRRKDVIRLQLEHLYCSLVVRLVNYKSLNLISPLHSSCYAQLEMHVKEASDFLLRTADDQSPAMENFRKAFLETIAELHIALYSDVLEGNVLLNDQLTSRLFHLCRERLSGLVNGGALQGSHSKPVILSDVPFTEDPTGQSTEVAFRSANASIEARALSAILAVSGAEEQTFLTYLDWTIEILKSSSANDQDVICSGLVKLCLRGDFWFKSLINLSYSTNDDEDRVVARQIFRVLVKLVTVPSSGLYQPPNPALITLLTWNIGCSFGKHDDASTAHQAMDAIGVLIHRWVSADGEFKERLPPIYSTVSGKTQTLGQESVARMFADYFPEMAVDVCKETSLRIDQSVEKSDIRNGFMCLASWVRVAQTDELDFIEFARGLVKSSSRSMPIGREAIAEMWRSFGDAHPAALAQFVVDETLAALFEGSEDSLKCIETCRLVSFCTFEVHPLLFLDRISAFLAPRSADREEKESKGLPFEAMYRQTTTESPRRFSRSDAAVVLLADVVADSLPSQVADYLPLCLTGALLSLDKTNHVVAAAARCLIVACVSSASQAAKDNRQTDVFLNLRDKTNRYPTGRDNTVASEERYTSLLDGIQRMVSGSNESFCSRLSHQAMLHASECPDVWYASKALSIVRRVGKTLSEEQARKFILGIRFGLEQDLSESSLRESHLAVCSELLSTVYAIVRRMTEEDLVLHTQIFWMSACLIGADHPKMQLISLRVVLEFVTRTLLDFPDRTRLGFFSISKPSDWSEFAGLQNNLLPLVTCSDVNLSNCSRVLLTLMGFTLDDSVRVALFDCSQNHLAHVILAVLPWICSKLQVDSSCDEDNCIIEYYRRLQDYGDEHWVLGDTSDACEATAILLALACAQKSANRLAEVFMLYSRTWKTMSLSNFVTILRKPLAEAFFPEQFHVVLGILLIEIRNSGAEFLGILLHILWSVLHQVDVTDEVSSHVNKCATKISQAIVLASSGPHAELALLVLDLAVHKFGVEVKDDLPTTGTVAQVSSQRKFVWSDVAGRIACIQYPGHDPVPLTPVDLLPLPLSTAPAHFSPTFSSSQASSYLTSDQMTQSIGSQDPSSSPRLFLGGRIDESFNFFRRVRRRRSKSKSRGLSLDSYDSIIKDKD